MARLLAFRGLVSSSSSPTPRLHHHHDSLVRIVALGIGSLDDMVAALDRSAVPVNQDSLNAVIDTCTRQASDGGGGSGSGRRLLRFFSWCLPQFPREHLGDDVFNRAIRAFAAMKDLTAMGIAISHLHEERRMMTLETFTLVADTLVKSGEEDDAVRLFRGLVRARRLQIQDGGGEGANRGLLVVVHALCARGHAGVARGVVWRHRRNLLSGGGEATRIIQQSLLHGWCVRGDFGEARRVMDEMKSLGFPPTIAMYNDLLLCLCKKNVKSNPSALVPEATNLMTEMRTSGVPAATASFNILLSSLSRVRRTKEAYRILNLMQQQGEAECSPDWASYHIVIRLMYLTGRFVRGDRLLEEMLEAGLLPGASFYRSLVGLLCGLEKVDHALQVFDRMKRCGQYNAPTYELLIKKLSRSGRFEQATNLWEEATERNVILQCSRDLLDPSKTEVFKPGAAQKKVKITEL